ncbi:MAG TPA: DAK2 domain-containing protein [Ruminiclostridium sp.]
MVYSIKDVQQVIKLSIEEIVSSKDVLTDLDSLSGDGDMGISMEKGALALKSEFSTYEGEDIGEFFIKCALAFNKAAPSTMGTLLSGAIMALGKEFKGQRVMDDTKVIKIPAIMAKAIMNRGKAQIGDKTIIDALIPLSNAFEASYNENIDLKIALKEASKAAKQGAEDTKGMMAKVGRAKWKAERSQEYLDGGAVLCSIIITALAGLPRTSYN